MWCILEESSLSVAKEDKNHFIDPLRLSILHIKYLRSWENTEWHIHLLLHDYKWRMLRIYSLLQIIELSIIIPLLQKMLNFIIAQMTRTHSAYKYRKNTESDKIGKSPHKYQASNIWEQQRTRILKSRWQASQARDGVVCILFKVLKTKWKIKKLRIQLQEFFLIFIVTQPNDFNLITCSINCSSA